MKAILENEFNNALKNNTETTQNDEIIKTVLKKSNYRDIGIISPNFRLCEFSEKDNSEIYEFCKRYVDKFDFCYEHNIGLLIHGKVGCGKSHLCACMANAIIDKLGNGVLMANHSDIIDSAIRENWIWENALICKCLIIDDFGAVRQSDYSIERTYELINARCNLDKGVTIINTNLNKSELNATGIANERVFSRIKMLCPKTIIMTGEDRRESIAKGKCKLLDEVMSND